MIPLANPEDVLFSPRGMLPPVMLGEIDMRALKWDCVGEGVCEFARSDCGRAGSGVPAVMGAVDLPLSDIAGAKACCRWLAWRGRG
jgi:hypothetical protein